MNKLARQPWKSTRDGMAQVLHPLLRIARHHIRPLRSSRPQGRRGSGAAAQRAPREILFGTVPPRLRACRRAEFLQESEEERLRNASSFHPPPTVGC